MLVYQLFFFIEIPGAYPLNCIYTPTHFFSKYNVWPICIRTTWKACLKCRILGSRLQYIDRISEYGVKSLTSVISPEFSKTQTFDNQSDISQIPPWNEKSKKSQRAS